MKRTFLLSRAIFSAPKNCLTIAMVIFKLQSYSSLMRIKKVSDENVSPESSWSPIISEFSVWVLKDIIQLYNPTGTTNWKVYS